jgi:hypothetical protein
LCEEAGVKLVYLAPYSPDLNPIEEFFAELKSFIRWMTNVDFQAGMAKMAPGIFFLDTNHVDAPF